MDKYKIVITTIGSLGDIHPYIAIARELTKRGHRVTFATNEFYRRKVEEEAHLKFAPIRPDMSKIKLQDVKNIAKQSLDKKTGSKFIMEKVLLPSLLDSYQDLLEVSKDADALVSHLTALAAPMVAAKLNIAWLSGTVSPMHLMSSHDQLIIPTSAGTLRFTSNHWVNKGFLLLLKILTAQWTVEINKVRLKLKLPIDFDPFFRGQYSPTKHLALFSQNFAKIQPDYPKKTQLTGFPIYDKHQQFQSIPDEIQQFLQQGDAPLIFTLGSSSAYHAGNFFKEAAKASKLLGERALLLIAENPDNVSSEDLSDDIVAYPYIPYSLIFPYAKAIIYHGGTGTLAQALQSGKPQLICPFGQEQFDNASRLKNLGVARVIESGFTCEKFSKELSILLENPSYSNQALIIGDKIRQENGVMTACDIIEKQCFEHRPITF